MAAAGRAMNAPWVVATSAGQPGRQRQLLLRLLRLCIAAVHHLSRPWLSDRFRMLLLLLALTVRRVHLKVALAGRASRSPSRVASVMLSSSSRALALAGAALHGVARVRSLQSVVRRVISRGVARQLMACGILTSTLWEGRKAYRIGGGGMPRKVALAAVPFAVAPALLPAPAKRRGTAIPQHRPQLLDSCPEVDEISQVLDWLFLGGAPGAANAEALKSLDIGHILNCCERLPFASDTTRNQKVCMEDIPTERLVSHLPVAFNFIKEAKRSGGRCLVHCRTGASRSVAIVLAYLVMHEGMRISDAWALVRSRRPVAKPNRGFVGQLIDLDLATHGQASMPPVGLIRGSSGAGSVGVGGRQQCGRKPRSHLRR